MTRLNVYVPDELASAAREAGLNVSSLTLEAITAALNRSATSTWLQGLAPAPGPRGKHQDAMAALEQAREDLDVV